MSMTLRNIRKRHLEKLEIKVEEVENKCFNDDNATPVSISFVLA